METRFTHLIDFDSELGLYACEDIVNSLDKFLTFGHSEVIEHYDNEDKAYDIYMNFRADDRELILIVDYLDVRIPGRYSIKQREC